MGALKLTIELVPSTAWFKNVRSEVSREEWDYIRRETYKNSNYRCDICGGIGDKWPVECHEIWEYDDDSNRQTLIGLTSLCPQCHEVKHMGRAEIVGRYDEASAHFAMVNGISGADADKEIRAAFLKWFERSKRKWKCDISWLQEFLKDKEVI